MEKFIKKIVIKSGTEVAKKFGKIGSSYSKSNSLDVVTQADLISNKIIIDSIKSKFPKHGIISEETGKHNVNSDKVWIIDPLDGTLNFATGIPLFCILIAYCEKGVVKYSVVYDPIHKNLYYAQKDKGAFLNGKRIYVSKQQKIQDSTGCYSDKFSAIKLKKLTNLLNKNKSKYLYISSLACAGLSAAFVASGNKDWYISTGGKVWDYAATSLILKEAGAKVTDLEGVAYNINSENGLVCSNKYLHSSIIKYSK